MVRPIIISSNLIVDDIWLADGSHQGEFPGGAALWAAIGACHFWPQVGILAGVGADCDRIFGTLVHRFGLMADGHLRRDDFCIRSRLAYQAEDQRSETPVFGGDHFTRIQVTLSAAPQALLPAAGTYVFRDLWGPFWQDVRQGRDRLGTLFWELQGDAARPDCLPAIRDLLPLVDVFSLNAGEATALTGMPPADAVAHLLEDGAPVVVLREGADGALVATPHQRFRVLPAPGPVVDVTGGGNAFCGGFLAGLVAHPGDLPRAARSAAAAAALILRQFGPPPNCDIVAAKDLAATVALRFHSRQPA
jgi:pfkB family carbohydrate kinase